MFIRLRNKWLWVRVPLQSLKIMFCACLKQAVPWNWGNYRLWIHSGIDPWNDNIIPSDEPSRLKLWKELNHLASFANWLSFRLQTKWLCVRVLLQLLKFPMWCMFQEKSFLTFRQLYSVNSLCSVYITWLEHTVKFNAIHTPDIGDLVNKN